MADVDVDRVVFPKSSFTPVLVLVGFLHHTLVRLGLFFSPLIFRVCDFYERVLRILTLPYQCCCTVMLFAFMWPFVFCLAWFYLFIRLWEWFGWPIRDLPGVATLMGPLEAVVVAPPPRRGALPGARSAVTAASASGPRRRAAPVPAPAPVGAPPAASSTAMSSASTSTKAQTAAGTKTSEIKTTAASPSGGSAATSTSSAANADSSGAAAAPDSRPKKLFRDRSPDGWFGPPPPEEGGPEPPYVPYDPNFVDPTDYLPEEELAHYKIYKRRTPFRRVP